MPMKSKEILAKNRVYLSAQQIVRGKTGYDLVIIKTHGGKTTERVLVERKNGKVIGKVGLKGVMFHGKPTAVWKVMGFDSHREMMSQR